MKKWISLLLIILLFPFIFFFGSFALMSGEHHYARSDIFSYWLYTPDTLKNLPEISKDAEYLYYYDLDDQRETVVVRWRNIDDITGKKTNLLYFLQQLNPTVKYNCVWIYHDQQDFSDHYERYCISLKQDVLELEYFAMKKRD